MLLGTFVFLMGAIVFYKSSPYIEVVRNYRISNFDSLTFKAKKNFVYKHLVFNEV